MPCAFLRGHELTPSVTLWSLFLLCFALRPLSLLGSRAKMGRQRERQREGEREREREREGTAQNLLSSPSPCSSGAAGGQRRSAQPFSRWRTRGMWKVTVAFLNACHGLILCRWTLAWPVLKQNPSTPGISWLFELFSTSAFVRGLLVLWTMPLCVFSSSFYTLRLSALYTCLLRLH